MTVRLESASSGRWSLARSPSTKSREVLASGLGLVLGDHATHVEAVARPVQGVLRVPARGVVAHPRDRGSGLAVGDGLLVERVGVLALAGDVAAVVGDAGHDDSRVVGGVRVAVADRHGTVAPEGAGLVDDEVDVHRIRLAVPVRVRETFGRRHVQRVLGRIGPVEQALLLLAQVLAGRLLGLEVVEVTLHRRSVGIVAVTGRDAVGVADQVRVADLQGFALGGGEACSTSR